MVGIERPGGHGVSRVASVSVTGRIPGREGLWELDLEGDTVRGMECVDPAAAEPRGRWITPGLFDLQINGIGGINLTERSLTVEQASRADELVRASGTSRWCPTVITSSFDTARAALGTLAGAMTAGRMPGAHAIHLEGPWLSDADGPRGIHRREFVRDPTVEEWDALQQAALGRIGILTIAPERRGAVEVIRRAARAGVVVSIGHTAATPEAITAAVEAGARMSTHLFNGCADLQGRHTNVIYSQLAEDRLYACFIADGHHVPFHALRIGLRTKGPERSIMVSDLAPLSGLPDGEYEMEGNRVVLKEGGLRVKDSGLLSAAARTLAEDVQWLSLQPEPGVEQALLMATRNPAALVGDPSWAELEPGRRGPLAVFSWDGSQLRLEQRIGF